MERRNNDNDDPARRQSNPNVFHDDYEIDPNEDDFMPSVSDGFRPANTSAAWQNSNHEHDRVDTHNRRISTATNNEHDLRRMATRNSTTKARESMTQDGRPQLHRAPSGPSPLAHRDSISSTGSFATTSNSDNPFESGPSHPYGMYPQGTVARSASIATTATEQQPHRSMSIQRPTHPYAMYSQSGLQDEESIDASAPPRVPQIQTAIPMGFPGLNNGYHRVLGPDGEEQDIIGPDGHTEQLPPYSRFPEEGPTKASLAAEASASRIVPAPGQMLDSDDPFLTPVSPMSPLSADSFSTPGAMSSAPLLPSVTPARLPPQRPETQSGNVAPVTSTRSSTIPAEPSDSASASLLTTEEGFSEKREEVPSEVPWHKKKVLGRYPLGVCAISAIIVLIILISVGAALGAVLGKKRDDEKGGKGRGNTNEESQPVLTGTNGSLFGAIPISTPVGFQPLPTGAFSLPLGIPQESNPSCLTQANQYSAWSCKMTFAPLVITVNLTSDSNQDDFEHLASIRSGNSIPGGAILYGLQTPLLELEDTQLVVDLDYKAYGPAVHFAARYDKLVILRPEELSYAGSSSFAKRQDNQGFRQRFQVRPGDYPWYCFWNSTYIEGYIYSQDNSTAASLTALPTTGSLTAIPTTASDGSGPVQAATAPPSASEENGTQTITTSSSATITSAPVNRRDGPPPPGETSPPRMSPYPRIVKIEERRLQNSPQPYCQQMILLDDGTIATATNSDGPVRIWLQESDPSPQEYFAENLATDSKVRREEALAMQKRGDPVDACHCQWMFK